MAIDVAELTKTLTETEIVNEIRRQIDDLNDTIQLALNMKLSVDLKIKGMYIDPTGAGLNHISARISKEL